MVHIQNQPVIPMYDFIAILGDKEVTKSYLTKDQIKIWVDYWIAKGYSTHWYPTEGKIEGFGEGTYG
jgi:hypothetical protein